MRKVNKLSNAIWHKYECIYGKNNYTLFCVSAYFFEFVNCTAHKKITKGIILEKQREKEKKMHIYVCMCFCLCTINAEREFYFWHVIHKLVNFTQIIKLKLFDLARNNLFNFLCVQSTRTFSLYTRNEYSFINAHTNFESDSCIFSPKKKSMLKDDDERKKNCTMQLKTSEWNIN